MTALEPESAGFEKRDDVGAEGIVDLDENASTLRRAQRLATAPEDVRLCPIDIELDEVRAGQMKQRDEIVERRGRHGLRIALMEAAGGRCPGGRRESLDLAQPYVVFLGSSPIVGQRSRAVRFVTRWIEELRASGDERLRRLGIVIRPHPVGTQWDDVDLSHLENVVIWPRRSRRPVTPEEHADFFDSLAHSAAVIGINTTAMIEAAIVGKNVLTILEPRFAQESTLHFHYLLEENGFLHVASSLAEHLRQRVRVLEEGDQQAQRRTEFIESFVRPHGLRQPATPILADAGRWSSPPFASNPQSARSYFGSRLPWTFHSARPRSSSTQHSAGFAPGSEEAVGGGRQTK